MHPFAVLASAPCASDVHALFPIANAALGSSNDILATQRQLLHANKPLRFRTPLACCMFSKHIDVCCTTAFQPCFWRNETTDHLCGCVTSSAAAASIVDFTTKRVLRNIALGFGIAHAAWCQDVDNWAVLSIRDVHTLCAQFAHGPALLFHIRLMRVPYTCMCATPDTTAVIQSSYGGGVWVTCMDMRTVMTAVTIQLVHEQPTHASLPEAAPAFGCCSAQNDVLYVIARDPAHVSNIYVLSLHTWTLQRWFPLPWTIISVVACPTPGVLRLLTSKHKLKTIQLAVSEE